MKHYILLPGYHSDENTNFYPWLRAELNSQGKHVQVIPYYDFIDNKSETDILEYIVSYAKLDSEAVLIGHSLGGALALKLLEKAEVQISKLVLVASFVTPKFLDKVRSFEARLSWNFDFEKIKRNAREIVILSDETDYIVPKAAGEELQEKLGGRLIEFKAQSPHIKGPVEPMVLQVVTEESQ